MVVFHTDKLGLSVTFGVYVLMFYADYAIVYQVIEYGKHESSTSRTMQMLLTHVLLIMCIFCHLRAMLSDPGYVPLPRTKIDFSSDLEMVTTTIVNGKKKQPPAIDAWTPCSKCETYRPPRSHHCRKCRRCVRRMDHHCPWINNCVGEKNFKYFFSFVVYIAIYTLYGFILVINDWRVHYGDDKQTPADKVMTLVLFFECAIFGMFVLAVGSGQVIAILCDRNAVEIRRYGHPKRFPTTPRMVLIQGMCGRGSKLLWLVPCVAPRIPDPIPPSKYASALNASVHNV
ncbi:palmitoyltransferase ZDHHC3-like isoform X2 [Halichondria panicea]|uniref:palmitoyltransferase ZDHHC3-like isoform X2 n=1 Tax=Halichondria panicea TaxID=6063 RepID=UPI00312B3F7E